MFKIKKKVEKPKPPILYNVIEDYSEFDAPGNVTVCAMTLPEDVAAHAKILAESYEVPLDEMTSLLTNGASMSIRTSAACSRAVSLPVWWMRLVWRPSRRGYST